MKRAGIPPDTPCRHCGLPVGTHPVGTDPYFCCTGCEMVYETLHAAGYGETFYQLREVSNDVRRATPAGTRIDALKLSELDSDAFIEEHTRLIADGPERAVDLFLDGVHCAACVWLVERMPFVLDGVSEARLDLPRARLSVRWDPGLIRLSEVARWLAKFGYTAHPVRQTQVNRRTDAERRLLMKVGVSWALAGNVMLIAFALYSGLNVAEDGAMAGAARWASLVLSLPSVIYGGSEFFRRAWSSLRLALQSRNLRLLHMDTPISLGILVGFAHSAWATMSGEGEVWFDSITVLIAALLTARWLQLRSRRLAGDAADRLLSIIPSMARRVDAQGQVTIVRIDELQPGDLVEVPSGEAFPVDGVVATGTSSVDNAVLTGESRPERIKPGDEVRAGATNLSAPVQVLVQATAEATRVGKLLAWLNSQGERKAPVVMLADRISGVFVLTVLALSLATFVLWSFIAPEEAVHHVVALLVISCPCALGMATPLAMAVASGKAARTGIFVKNEEALQQLTRVTAIVLDKTGTLTEGRMTLVEYEGDEDAVDLAAALETRSNHPIGRALVQARGVCLVDDDGADLSSEAVAGKGIRGRIYGRDVIVGKPDWVAENTSLPDATLQTALERFSTGGLTPVGVGVDGRFVSVLAVGDRLRDTTADTIARLKETGKALYLLSGDHQEVAHAVAGQLDLPTANVFGDVSPEGKTAFVQDLQAQGHVVAMVGDGVNDAAALQAADVGIAVQGGSSASLVAADVFLTRPGLEPVAELLAGSSRVMRIIRRNLTVSLLYNLAGAGAAIAGLVTPLVAAVAMPISSLFVVASSILSRSFGSKRENKNWSMTSPAPGEKADSGTVAEGMVSEAWA